MGYAGGTTEEPTYTNIGDHAETIEIDFDPEVTSYRDLLDAFWSGHNPCAKPWSRQYMSAIFVHDGEQRRLAEETAHAVSERTGQPVTTEILPFTGFTLAEDYHQKHRLRRLDTVTSELETIYPDLGAFVRSTTATRANAFAGGTGTRDELDEVAGELGLSANALEELRRTVR